MQQRTTKRMQTFVKCFFVNACILLSLKLCAVECVVEVDLLHNEAEYLEAKVGSYVVFNCPLDFPQEMQIPFILQWKKEVRSVNSDIICTLQSHT